MYKIMSNYFGQLSAKSTIDLAIETANGYKTKALTGEIISVWKDGITLYKA